MSIIPTLKAYTARMNCWRRYSEEIQFNFKYQFKKVLLFSDDNNELYQDDNYNITFPIP